ncbi:MAG: hypothetical protein K1X94_28575 [Sandaracinaceae bacterium]|nr:hypothetical protein [Sandaracinaceae bacterium]
MRFQLRSALWILGSGLAVTACGPSPAPTDDAGSRADAATSHDAAIVIDAFAAADAFASPDAFVPTGTTHVAAGEASGAWCGSVIVDGTVHIAAGQTVTICAGSDVRVSAAAAIQVEGTLLAEGTSAGPITFGGLADARWTGLVIDGTATLMHTTVRDATRAIEGRAGSIISVDHGGIEASMQAFQLANGATFTSATILGGSTNGITGGVLAMTDVTLDLEHPVSGPDCTDWSGGGAMLDHVHLTGCHCPIHINRATAPIEITNSILDGASYPIMIAESDAQIHGNHLIDVANGILDIGDGAGITADVSGNYWGGGAADISSSRPGQFTGADVVESAPIAGVGPRP